MTKYRSFTYRVIAWLEKDGYRVHPVKDSKCPFDLLSVNPEGTVAGVKCKAHGHLTKAEKRKLLWYKMPMYRCSEVGEHEIVKKRLKVEEKVN